MVGLRGFMSGCVGGTSPFARSARSLTEAGFATRDSGSTDRAAKFGRRQPLLDGEYVAEDGGARCNGQ